MAAIAYPRAERVAVTARAWRRMSVAGLALATSSLYLWGLGQNGWANAYYAAAVQAGTKSWKAFFFGSLDASNFITVDKSPAFLWVMEISARLFGFNYWSVLVPQALEGVATVLLVYLAVRRWFGHAAGLIAGAVVALTPVAALMFRFNNPDALLVLLLTGSAYATLRATETGHTRWLLLAAVLVGTGFLAKMLQAFVIVPVLAGVYLIAGRPRLRTRILQLVAAAFALVVASGWWVAAVQLWPAADRPYVGGSQDNNLLNLILGYNGFGRITGNETGSVGGFGAIGSRWGITGWDRLFLNEFGGQVSWLIPAALILGIAVLWFARREARTGMTRASVLMWGGILLVTGAVFSFAQGIIHPYYAIALAPAIGALTGIGAVATWRRRHHAVARWFLAAAVLVTVVWSFALLERTPDWNPALRYAIAFAGLVAAALIAAGPLRMRPAAAAVAAVALVAALAGPAAYTLQTVTTAHSGAIPSAGPVVAASFSGPGGFGGRPPRSFGGQPPAGAFQRPTGGGPVGAFPSGGGFLNASQSNSQLSAALEADASRYRWVAATVDANSAAGYELATGEAVMAIGGFNGTDPAPSLAEFEAYVSSGQIHYFIAGGVRGFGNGSATGAAGEIAGWVEQHYTAKTIGGVTVYDLDPLDSTQPAAG